MTKQPGCLPRFRLPEIGSTLTARLLTTMACKLRSMVYDLIPIIKGKLWIEKSVWRSYFLFVRMQLQQKCVSGSWSQTQRLDCWWRRAPKESLCYWKIDRKTSAPGIKNKFDILSSFDCDERFFGGPIILHNSGPGAVSEAHVKLTSDDGSDAMPKLAANDDNLSAFVGVIDCGKYCIIIDVGSGSLQFVLESFPSIRTVDLRQILVKYWGIVL